jgi:homoisocitrate dehydrogenase
LFEPVHGAAPDIAGKGIANPLAAIGCVVMLLEWAAQQEWSMQHAALRKGAAQRVQDAIAAVLRAGPHTPDLGGSATTHEVTDAVISQIETSYSRNMPT